MILFILNKVNSAMCQQKVVMIWWWDIVGIFLSSHQARIDMKLFYSRGGGRKWVVVNEQEIGGSVKMRIWMYGWNKSDSDMEQKDIY